MTRREAPRKIYVALYEKGLANCGEAPILHALSNSCLLLLAHIGVNQFPVTTDKLTLNKFTYFSLENQIDPSRLAEPCCVTH